MIFETIRAILGDLFEGILELLVRERTGFVKQLAKILQYLLDRANVALVSVDQQLVAASADTNVEQRSRYLIF